MNKPFQGRAIADQTAIATAFLVAGMHRSGTSAMARVVSILGAELPRTLMNPAADNPKGFWESARIAELNDALLADFGTSWDDLLAFLTRREELKSSPAVLDRISALLTAEFSLTGPIVVKEPRISLLLDVWLAGVTRERLAPRVIIPIRDPLEVCASLRARNGFAEGRSLLLWLSYFLAAEKASRGVRRVFVHYADLLEDWRGVVGRMERALDVRFAGYSPSAELEIDKFLSREDRHQRFAPELIGARADVVNWVKQAYAWANTASSQENEPDTAPLDAIAEAFASSTRVYAPVIAEQRAAIAALRVSETQLRQGREEDVQRLTGEVQLVTTQRDMALAQNVEQQARMKALEANVRDREVHLYALEGDLRDRNERLEALQTDVAAFEAQAAEQAEALRARDMREQELQQNLTRLKSAEAALGAQVIAMEARARERGQRADSLAQELSEARAKLDELTAQSLAAAGALAEKDEQLQALTAEAVAQEARRSAIEADATAAIARIAELEAQARSLEERLAAALTEVDGHVTRERALEAEVKSRDFRAQTAEADLQARDARTRAMEAELQALRAKVSEQAMELQASKASEKALAEGAAKFVEIEAKLKDKVTQLEQQGAAQFALLRARSEKGDAANARVRELTRELEAKAEHIAALEASVQASTERAIAVDAERDGLRLLADNQAAFIANSRSFGRRVRRALWSRPYLRWASDLIEMARLSLSRGPLEALRLVARARAFRAPGAFDADFYLHTSWDVAAIGQDPTIHYAVAGAAEGRDPSPQFSTRGYMQRYPDVARGGANPLFHYLRHGKREGRIPTAAVVDSEPPQAPALSPAPPPPQVDPYSLRPDDCVADEAARGAAFMERFKLLSDTPDWAGAVAALNGAAPALANQTLAASIVVPVYGQLAYTLNCLDSLFSHRSKHHFEVIVVDDRSPDASREWLSRLRGIRFHQRPQNGGFIEASNDGAKLAKGQILIMLNNDTRVVAGWLDALVDSFETLEDAELVGSKLFYPDGSLQEAGGIIWQDGSAWNYGRNDDPGKPEYNYARPVDYVSGASIAIPKKVWDEIGGFDARYKPAYCEDSDLALKIRYTRKKQVWLQPQSRVIHFEGKTSGVDVTQGVKMHQVRNTETLFDTWRHVLAAHRPNGEAPLLEKDRGVTKRALVLDATTPEPNKDAGSVTCVALMRALQAAGYKVSFAAEDNLLYLPHASAPLQAMGIEVLYAPYEMSMDAILEKYGAAYDLALVFRFGVVGKHIKSFRKHCPGMPVIMHCSDLHFLREERHAKLLGDPKKIAAAEATRARELEVIRSVDVTIVHSPIEKEVVAAGAPDARVYVFPYIQSAEPRTTPFRDRRDIAFLGGYRHTPNVDAVLYFAERIWPKIHRARPGMRFVIAGSECPKELLDLQGKQNIHVAGFVEDLKSFFSGIRLSVAPIRYGAGVKGKVAVALGHGLPTVLTTCAAEGMGLVDGDAVLIRDDEDAFARAVIELYDDEKRWTAMSDHALQFVENEYGAALTQKRLMELLALAGVGAKKPR